MGQGRIVPQTIAEDDDVAFQKLKTEMVRRGCYLVMCGSNVAAIPYRIAELTIAKLRDVTAEERARCVFRAMQNIYQFNHDTESQLEVISIDFDTARAFAVDAAMILADLVITGTVSLPDLIANIYHATRFDYRKLDL